MESEIIKLEHQLNSNLHKLEKSKKLYNTSRSTIN